MMATTRIRLLGQATPIPIHNEVPAGTINGSNTVFTLATTPSPDSEQIFVNGVRQKKSANDYSISGATITFTLAPLTDDVLLADYSTPADSFPGSLLFWNNVTGTSQQMAVHNGYVANNAALVTFTLPITAPLGTIQRVVGSGAGGWKVAQNASQIIHFGNVNSTAGVTGSVASINRYDAMEFICIVDNTEWAVISSQGNVTVA